MRDVDELEEEDEGAGDVCDAAAAPADVTDEVEVGSVKDEFELVVSLCAIVVVVLVMVVGGIGGQRLPDASSTPRKSPGMKLNSVDGEQHVSLPLTLQQ